MERSAPFLAYRSFYTPLNTLEKFGQIGYDTVCLFPAHTVNSRGTPYSQYPPTWLWFDVYDFTVVDKIIADVSRAWPGVRFLCMIDLNSPVWLEHMNWLSCSDTFNNLGKALHNPDWLAPTERYLRSFVEYCESRYADRILAYMPCCGATDEWYDYSQGTEDANRRAAWRKWRQAQGKPDPIDITPASVREHVSHDGFLRSPQKDEEAVAYWRFCNETVADAILHFARIIRSVVRRPVEVGCFYGYILEKTARTLVSCGHLEYEKVLDAPEIDFLIAPGTYQDREMGGGSGFLIPNGTAAVRGKRLLHECDQRTHTYNSYLSPHINLRLKSAWPNEKASVAGLKREAALGLIKRTHLWWFDMWGDFYQGEKVMQTLARARELWSLHGGQPARDASQTAMIVDPESTYYVNQDDPRVRDMNLGTRNRLNRLGAPFEVFSFQDIPRCQDFDRFRLVVFTSAFVLTPEKIALLREHVLNRGRTVVWLYGPGIIQEGRLDPAFCETISGIPYDSTGVVCRDMGDWTSCYIHDYKELTVAVLKDLAAKAGVHLYCDEEFPVYAEGDLLAVHAATGDVVRLRLPAGVKRVTELFSGREEAVGADGCLDYACTTPDTMLFQLQR
jgi:hypothetical protein